MLKHLQLPPMAQGLPSPLSIQSQPLQTSLSSHGPMPPLPKALPSHLNSIPMAPSISQASTFSVGGVQTTAHPSPQLDISTTAALNIRPLDMMMGHEEVYEELERRIDEMRGWLECVEVGLDDLLRSPTDPEGEQGVIT